MSKVSLRPQFAAGYKKTIQSRNKHRRESKHTQKSRTVSMLQTCGAIKATVCVELSNSKSVLVNVPVDTVDVILGIEV
jgi:hypothetical protein